jgi:hypothetical protein
MLCVIIQLGCSQGSEGSQGSPGPGSSGRGSGRLREGLREAPGGAPGTSGRGSGRLRERLREGPGGSGRLREAPGSSGRGSGTLLCGHDFIGAVAAQRRDRKAVNDSEASQQDDERMLRQAQRSDSHAER